MKGYYRRRRIYKRRTLKWMYGIAIVIMAFNLILFVSVARGDTSFASEAPATWQYCHEPSYVGSALCDPAQPGIQTEAEMEQYWNSGAVENLKEA